MKMAQIEKVLKKIEGQKGIIKPSYVVDEAESENSPIHHLFNWNNDSAAEQFRLLQAGQLITKIKIKIENKKLNAFQPVNIIIENEQSRGYVSTEKVLNDDEMKKQVLSRAVKEISYWQKTYDDIENLKGVVNEVKLKEIKNEL